MREILLIVSATLDRELVPEYDILLTVTDAGTPPLSDNETIQLHLLDVNDNAPQFPQSFYTIRVMENNAPGALLSSLTAFDPDLHENQYLVYFILEKEIANTSMSMLFSINPENGNLYALKTFDYEIEKDFLFHIEARDSGSPPLSSNVTVHIIIVDQNDNAPVIVSPWRAHGSVVEEKIPRSTDKGSLVAKVIALDTDSVHNSRITYQFLQVTDATLFSLDQYNGEIRTMRMFSYRDPRHQRLVVIAKDNGEPALSATVTIKFSLSNAVDPDVGSNSVKTYHLSESEYFNIEVQTGREGTKFIEKDFLFHIEARDSGSPPLSSNVTVHIIIVDQNDNAPVIVSPWRAHGSVVEEKIPRSTEKGSLVAKVIALDTDSVHNSRITYQFLQVTDATLFSLDQYNGEIRTMRMFSYRDPRHQRLVVIAKDNGEPALSATVTIKLSTME
uniref:Si:ch73-233f7.4 n=1 Tax=Labrus bergylta TaxID=56723 RepID=A0A3Q3F1F4_9LABR